MTKIMNHKSPLEEADDHPGRGRNEDDNSNDFDSSSESSSVKSSTLKQGGTHTSETRNSEDDTNNENTRVAIKAKLAKQNNWKVKLSRGIVIMVLIVTAAVTSYVVYAIAHRSEQNELYSQYESASSKIAQSFGKMITRLGVINSIGIAATIEGLTSSSDSTWSSTTTSNSSNSSWPYVTLPMFQQRTQTVRVLTEVLYLSIHPLVSHEERDKWERYVVTDHAKSWISEGLQYQEQIGWENFEYDPPSMEDVLMMNETNQPIYYRNESGQIVVAPTASWYLPQFQTSPVLKNEPLNFDVSNTHMKYRDHVQNSMTNQKAVLGTFEYAASGPINDTNYTIRHMATLRSFANHKVVNYLGAPFANFYIPIFDTLQNNQERNVVALMVSTILLRQYLIDILPDNVAGITAVFEDSCSGNFTYEINGALADVLGPGDLHETKYNTFVKVAPLDINTTIYDGTSNGTSAGLDSCTYAMRLYQTQTFTDQYITKTPVLIALGVAGVFAFTIMAFMLYNQLVESRQSAILDKAAHSTAIVSSLFPKQVRDRLLECDQDGPAKSSPNWSGTKFGDITAPACSKQIADLFPNCTVLFADIAGFTAWSSTRGPEHVFILLQTVYQGFDYVARRRKVFKVETIGDCYLAVTGLPEPQLNHAIIMARFACECKQKMNELTKELDTTLGPDCSELKMRFGVNSGPVTAGVLRGDRARYQLFGDTVNTAARMESTGIKDKIQISQSTADILIKSGKAHWIQPREDSVEAKGKGHLNTYWLKTNVKGGKTSSEGGSSNRDSNAEASATSVHDENGVDVVKRERLIDWVVEMLSDQIKLVVVKNEALGFYACKSSVVPYWPQSGRTCLDEVQEVIRFCKMDKAVVAPAINPSTIALDSEALHQLRQYVQHIAAMYHKNPFHNLEHACHVTLSVSKLLNRVISQELPAEDSNPCKVTAEHNAKPHFHASTYGISSDPLAQFAVVFSALIHDVDHRGCSNEQLIKEEVQMGTRYKNKSVAEQNSVDLSWSLLMSDQFDKLRKTMFRTQEELLRFRQLIVNSVLATDIFDKELNDLRKLRWANEFSDTTVNDTDDYVMDRKATIVIEHIIQASDVSHTMQHWHIYQKWNTFLFKEMYQAYKAGRMSVDPSTFWYQGELNFFDNYVIPLANKLEECKVFGVSSDEYLNYAVCNRNEWEHRGEALMQEIIRNAACNDED